MRALLLVNQLWVIEPVNPRKIARLLDYYIKAIDHKSLWFRAMINHLGCWKNTRRPVVYEFFSCSTNIPRGLSAYNP